MKSKKAAALTKPATSSNGLKSLRTPRLVETRNTKHDANPSRHTRAGGGQVIFAPQYSLIIIAKITKSSMIFEGETSIKMAPIWCEPERMT